MKEVAIYGADVLELSLRGKSWWLSLDREWLPDLNCWFRLVVCGWAVEVYNG